MSKTTDCHRHKKHQNVCWSRSKTGSYTASQAIILINAAVYWVLSCCTTRKKTQKVPQSPAMRNTFLHLAEQNPAHCSCVKIQHNSVCCIVTGYFLEPLSRHHLAQNWTANLTEADFKSCSAPQACQFFVTLQEGWCWYLLIIASKHVNNAPLNLFVWQTGESYSYLLKVHQTGD